MKQEKYTHIKKAERTEIAYLLKKGYGVNAIAEALERSKGSISDEIKNNSIDGIYDPIKANHKAYVKRKYSKYQGMKVTGDRNLRNYVEEKLMDDWSPEQISGRIKEIDKHIKYIGFKGVYKFIYSPYGRQLEKCLRYRGKKRRSKSGKLSKIENRTFIDKRPEITNKRGRYGDWEGDLIVSGRDGKGVLLVLHERKSRFPIIEKIMSRKTDVINRHIYERTGVFVCFNSLTLDNDVSFSKHQELSAMLEAPIYFCHAYHSWEKGAVENTNQLIRRYIHKGADISRYTKAQIRDIETKLQNRPRKCLNFKTPLEVMVENSQFKTLEDFGIINSIKNPQAVRLEGVM